MTCFNDFASIINSNLKLGFIVQLTYTKMYTTINHFTFISLLTFIR